MSPHIVEFDTLSMPKSVYFFSQVPTSNEYNYRLEKLSMFVDEILELFGGANGDYLINNLTYKELTLWN